MTISKKWEGFSQKNKLEFLKGTYHGRKINHTIIIYFMIMILEKNEKNCFIFMYFFFKIAVWTEAWYEIQVAEREST